VVTTGAIRCAKLRIVTTNEPTPTTGQITFPLPNQQCQSTEGKYNNYYYNKLGAW